MLRAEARLLTTAGALLLALGFPLTLVLVALSLASRDASPWPPLALGAPFILVGYVACHYAARRMARALELEVAGSLPQ